MPVVEDYWSGVLRRLQAEVEVFNELITHPGELGRANELSLAQVIARLIPSRYEVGSGILIDKYDARSSQTDIVIYNRADEPALLAQSTQVLFPVENVRVCIEVKTTIGKDEIEDAVRKRQSVEDLVPITGSHPAYVLAGFEAELSVDTIAKHLMDHRPPLDLVCILKEGMIAGRADVLASIGAEAGTGSYEVGVTCLSDHVQAMLLEKLQASGAKSSARVVEFNGSLYPVIRRRPGQRLVTDPARALLLFCDGLLRLLAQRDAHLTPILSHYITDEARVKLNLSEPV